MRPAQSNSSRVLVFDLMRIILLFLVVHVHIHILVDSPVDRLSEYEYLAVPLFLILSFYLTAKYYAGDQVPVATVFTRIKRLFVPLAFWSLIGFLPHLSGLTPANFGLQLLTGEYVNLPLYYLNILIVLTILASALTYVRQSLRMLIYIALMAIAFYLQYSLINYNWFHPLSGPWQYSYSRVAELLPYAMVGLIFGKYKEKLAKDALYIVGVPILALAGLYYARQMTIPAGFNYQGYLLFFRSIIVFIGVLYMSHLRLDRHLPKLIHTLGQITFGVYLFHFTLLELLLLAVPSIKPMMVGYANIFLVIFTVICFVLAIAIDRVTKHKLSFLLR